MIEICKYKFVPWLPVMYNAIWHQHLNNTVDMAVFLCPCSNYDRGMKIMENNWASLLWTLSELKTRSWLLIRSCPLWAEIPPTIFCMYTSMDHSYSTHIPPIIHCTHVNKHMSLYWTWVTDVTLRAIQIAVICTIVNCVTGCSKCHSWNTCNFLTLHT
jgi:hypothetical protein